ncbi:hypothetical protein CNY89_22360, partial [Amaricoccus sp. HAR-UPW-R2A-40]
DRDRADRRRRAGGRVHHAARAAGDPRPAAGFRLGGGLTVTGPIADVVPVGEFTMRRGRLEILGQRLDFDEGSLQLTGNLDPQIRFVAQTRASDVTAYVTVTGRVSSPEISFSSQPALPQDEVLARVIFNRSVSQLSAFQIAQLAAAAAELAGG